MYACMNTCLYIGMHTFANRSWLSVSLWRFSYVVQHSKDLSVAVITFGVTKLWVVSSEKMAQRNMGTKHWEEGGTESEKKVGIAIYSLCRFYWLVIATVHLTQIMSLCLVFDVWLVRLSVGAATVLGIIY